MPNLEVHREITEPQEIAVPKDILTEKQKDYEPAGEHGEVFDDDCDDSDDPNGSHVFQDSDDPGEEFDNSELGIYEDLEVINCHNKHKSHTPMLMFMSLYNYCFSTITMQF